MDVAGGAKPTSRDVARRAGLSRSAVSQILNGNTDRFPEETRNRVFTAAAELSYRPSRVGRALVRGVSDLVVVVVPNATYGRHLQDTVDELADAATGQLNVVVRYAGDDSRSALTTVLDLAPTTVVDFGVFDENDRAALRLARIRILPDLHTVDEDFLDPNRLLGRLQAEEILRDSSRLLVYALLQDERGDPFGPTRLAGARDAAAEIGAPEPLVIRVPLNRGIARSVLSKFLREGRPLGICCYNDDVAIALHGAAIGLNLSIPKDVALIGADATEIGQLITPPLTTVVIDTTSIIRTLIGNLDGAPITDAESKVHVSQFVRVKHGATT